MTDPKQTEKLDDNMLVFCEMLLTKKGLDTMPEEVKFKMLMDLYTRVDNWVLTSFMQSLSPEHLEKLRDITETQEDPEEPDPDVLKQFFAENLDDYEKQTEQALKEFAQTFLEK